jgi:hypothetical protein
MWRINVAAQHRSRAAWTYDLTFCAVMWGISRDLFMRARTGESLLEACGIVVVPLRSGGALVVTSEAADRIVAPTVPIRVCPALPV